MNYKKVLLLSFPLLVLVLVTTSCTVKQQPIHYGEDACEFCLMTIVDKQHAAELVTKKGKAFKFDASECMINYLAEKEENDFELFLVADFSKPGTLINAKEAWYIISKKIPSPMGAFLSAVSTKDDAQKLQKEYGGNIYSWEELLQHLKK